MKKDDVKRYVAVSLGIAAVLSIMILMLCVKDMDSLSIDDLKQRLPSAFFCLSICLVSIVPISGIVIMLFLFLDSEVVQTKMHLLAKQFSVRLASRNADSIYPYLQSFIYELIKRNNEMLCLPLGQDVSTIQFNGYTVRSGSAFYQFSLISPDKPKHEINTLKQLIQSYINQELHCYGIYGLSAIYRGKAEFCYSVYVDRIFFDEDNHTLKFDILYVCTENAANYYQKAVQRDKKTVTSERTVYDDEV